MLFYFNVCPFRGMARHLENGRFLSDTHQNSLFQESHYVNFTIQPGIIFLGFVFGTSTAEKGKSFKANQGGCPEGLGGAAGPFIVTC